MYMDLIIDHDMFPVYNNNKFILEVAKEYKNKNMYLRLVVKINYIKEFIL